MWLTPEEAVAEVLQAELKNRFKFSSTWYTVSMPAKGIFKDCDWSIFRARLEQYFIANAITDAILLNTCDEDAYRLIFNLCIPENELYKDLVKLFDKHFKTTPRATKSRVQTFAEWP